LDEERRDANLTRFELKAVKSHLEPFRTSVGSLAKHKGFDLPVPRLLADA
jgi:hypothetical protein